MYSYRNGLSWFDGFFKLMDELCGLNYPITLKTEEELHPLQEVPKGQEVGIFYLDGGTYLKVGDFVQLADKIGNDYKNTLYHDCRLKAPSWELFLPSPEDFQHLLFYHDGNEEWNLNPATFGQVRRLYSECILQIESIRKIENTTFLYTNAFRIGANKALNSKEIRPKNPNAETKIANPFFDDLIERMENRRLGLTYEGTLSSLVSHWSNDSLLRFPKKWHWYFRSITGTWHSTVMHGQS